MNKFIKTGLALLFAATLQTAMAQPGVPQVQSPVVNKDNSVTFNYLNKTAQKVEVDVQFAGRHEMKKDDKGVWSITLGPTTPDIYPYCFIVDGMQVMDPVNAEWFPNEGFKNSLLDMRGDFNLPHA
ncbi:MAG: esterase, partial [Bacteroidales bacterium]|nr:esterase [Bacteroidales bacterium]